MTSGVDIYLRIYMAGQNFWDWEAEEGSAKLQTYPGGESYCRIVQDA